MQRVEAAELPPIKEETVSDDDESTAHNQISRPFEEYYYEDNNRFESATSFVLEMCEEKGSLCRICACSNDQLIDIFSQQGYRQQILKKIHIHLPIMVIEQDVLPSYVCPDCIKALNTCHSFIIKCLEADAQLKRIYGLEELIQEGGENEKRKFSVNDVSQMMISHWKLMIDTNDSPVDNDTSEVSDIGADNDVHSEDESDDDVEAEEETVEQDTETGENAENVAELDTGSEVILIKQPNMKTVGIVNPRTGVNEKVTVLDSTMDTAKKVFCCCKACDVMFSSLVEFVSHQILQHNVKMFSCSSCNSILNTSDSSFIQHLSTCQKKKPENISSANVTANRQSQSTTKQKEDSEKRNSNTGKLSKRFQDIERFLSRLPAEENNSETRKTAKNVIFQRGKVEITDLSDNKVYEVLKNSEARNVFKRKIDKTDVIDSKNKEKATSVKKKSSTQNEMERKGVTHFSCSLCKKKFIRRRQFMLHCHSGHAGINVPCVVLKHYPCNLCKVNFASYEKLKSHKEKHFSVKGVYNCADCGKLCTTKISIIQHLKKHQADTVTKKGYLCEVCGKECKDPSALKYHKEIHNDQEYVCDICGKTVKHINQHRQQHLREKIRYECTICGKSYDRKGRLEEHSNLHTGERPHKCTECPKTFHAIDKLRQHMLQHDEVPRYQCDLCDKRFRRLSQRTMHFKTHFNEEGFTCSICKSFFKKRKDLFGHRREHTDEEIQKFKIKRQRRIYKKDPDDKKRFTCDICGKVYRGLSGLYFHNQVHTGEKPHKCKICGATFRFGLLLRTHMYRHSGEKPFTCEICGKSFRAKPTLNQHKITHSSERPFVCNVCGKDFRRRDYLDTHMRIHTGERPFACKICGSAFKQVIDCRRHEERHYKNGDVKKV